MSVTSHFEVLTKLKGNSVDVNYCPAVKRRVENHECFSTSVFSSLFKSEDYSLAHSYTLQET